MELFPFLLEQDIQRMIIMKAIVAITKLMLLNLIRFSAMSVVIMDSTSADSESVSAMDFNSLYWSSVYKFVFWKSAMFKCYQWIVLDGTERTQVTKLDVVLVTVWGDTVVWWGIPSLRATQPSTHRGFAALCYQLLGIPKQMSLLLIPTICRRKFLCNTITKSLSDVIDIMWILNWNEMGVKQEKLTGPPIVSWSRIFAQVFNE